MEQVKCLLYVCKEKPLLEYSPLNCYPYNYGLFDQQEELEDPLNGKVVGEFDYEVEHVFYLFYSFPFEDSGEYTTGKDTRVEKESCLSEEEIYEYFTNNGENEDKDYGYGIHINNLNIFEKPKELIEYCKMVNQEFKTLYKAPQNMMVVYDLNHESGKVVKYILISVKSKYACDILNKIKTLELRKKVLKEMLNYKKESK